MIICTRGFVELILSKWGHVRQMSHGITTGDELRRTRHESVKKSEESSGLQSLPWPPAPVGGVLHSPPWRMTPRAANYTKHLQMPQASKNAITETSFRPFSHDLALVNFQVLGLVLMAWPWTSVTQPWL